jgi:UDP-N-acetylmuramoyl-L-alanyl-D-glutamate--2,6-diaminopimelate ligase
LLFASLGNGHNDKQAILNGDDKYVKKFLRLTNVLAYTYGLGEENDFQARNIVCDVNEIKFDLYYHEKNVGTVTNPYLFGFFNMYNLLAILSYFYIKGYNMQNIITGVKTLRNVAGRMQKVETTHPLHVFIDYAHTPDSVYRILNEIKMVSKKPIICVVGCGGNRDKYKRPIVGKVATSIASFTIFTSDNPRHEDPNDIINDIVKGACSNHYMTIENRKEAIKTAINLGNQDEIVVILGKGHENYQQIQDTKHYFNDYEEALNQINCRFNE